MGVKETFRARRRERLKPKIEQAARWAYLKGEGIDSRVFRRKWMQDVWEKAFREAETKEKERRVKTDEVSDFLKRLLRSLLTKNLLLL